MNLLTRFWWKSFTKPQRNYLMDRLSVVEQEAMKETLNGHVRVPAPLQEKNCIFIHVPKCAGKSMCASLFDGWSAGHVPLHWYEQMFPELYASAFKFTFVRDPLDRAYSAWCYLLGTDLKGNREARRMVESFDSFEDFILNWLWPENVQRQIHFAPQWQFVTNSLGMLAVDYVGRFEQIGEDYEVIRQKLGVSKPLVEKNRSSKRSKEDVTFSRAVRQRVYEVYRRDYELLGYQPDLD